MLSREGDTLLRRIFRQAADGEASSPATVLAASERLLPNAVNGLSSEHSLAEHLDPSWALVPRELIQENEQVILLFDDPGGKLLSEELDGAIGVDRFLHLAIGIASTVSKMHQQGLVHKNIKPSNILVNGEREVRLTGFGIASLFPRERQSPESPQFIAGTLAYMAPEQTGRMN